MEDIHKFANKLAKDAKKLKKHIEESMNSAKAGIGSIQDEKQKAFLIDALKLAKTGKLDITDFTKQLQKYK